MSEGVLLAQAADNEDPAIGLRAVRQLRELADRLERLHVGEARTRGWTWQEIAEPLGVSRQAVHKKYADETARPFGRRFRGKDS